jgi:CHAT domain-containing protein
MLRWANKRLFEHKPTTLLPNLSCLLLVPAHTQDVIAAGVIGNPAYAEGGLPRLPLAYDELMDIADYYRARGRLLEEPIEGASASERRFRQLSTREDAAGATLHVACHGDFVADEPLYSGLLLSDGKVDAAEIVNLRIRYSEVVLSACSSGVVATAAGGVPLVGDDIVGLVGALFEAGVRTAVVSMTRARDDATHSFMTTYHSHRTRGRLPREALQQTQRDMLSSGAYAPELWGGFVVYGH